MKNKKVLAMLSVLALSAPLASAADTGWYAGAGGGKSSFNGSGAELAPTTPGEVLTVTRLDNSSTGWKLFAGKQLHENLAVELAYTKLGAFSMDATVTGGIGIGPGIEYAEVKPECWSLSALGILPLGNSFSLLGKAGICRWDDRSRAYEVVAGVPIFYPNGAYSTGVDLTFGLGAKYDVTNNLGVRAEWERFNNVVHKRNSVDLLSISLQYGF